MARDVNKRAKKGPNTGYGSKYPGFVPKVGHDLGAESPNWRDHSSDLSQKTTASVLTNETCGQFLYKGWIDYRAEKSNVISSDGFVEIIGKDMSCQCHDDNADKWFKLLEQEKEIY